jgi:hypothetical protein
VSPVRYELGFYIPEDDILRNRSRENSDLTTNNLVEDEFLVGVPVP